MIAHIKKLAVHTETETLRPWSLIGSKSPAILHVDGFDWVSQTPLNAGEAQSINDDASRIIEQLKK